MITVLQGILKDTSLIIGVLAGLISLGSVFYGWGQKAKLKRLEEKRLDREAFAEEIIEATAEAMKEFFVQQCDHEAAVEDVIKKANAESNAINNKLDRVIKRQDKTESMRIKSEVVAAADDLRAGHEISETRFLAISESYKYYTETLKGNSFVHKEYEFISRDFYRKRHKEGEKNEKN